MISLKRLPLTLFIPALLILAFVTTFSLSAYARQLGDVVLPDSVVLKDSDVKLQLNGMGYRTKFVFKV